ncbi:MAG: DNA polymerase III subunit gamma/tau [Saprospiraceae bacterium]|nr:DNA polymerase III subunit gamma/tau [Saprospiraceae bacterium]
MSQFVVSARKYRPTTFSEVVGQESVTETLKNAFRNDSLAHAFLFCGPRGVGKTSCARILAKMLNCTNRTQDQEPCGTCESCTTFAQNASLNIIELDAASNNSVEHIRSLNEQVRFQPQAGTYKVFIIDEVHMLSQAAFNAFLKTLEEPPPYAFFILATTEKHKIIPTILSRCQIFDFKRIQTADIVAHLQQICTSEGITAEKEALHELATKCDGALRDALSLFDKMVSFGGKNITYQQVIDNLNLLDYEYFFRTTDALITEDLASVMQIFNQVLSNGFEGDAFVIGLAQHLRNLLICKYQALTHLLDLSDGQHEQYHAQAAAVEESYLLGALELLNDCDVDYRMAKNKRLHVEMALIKLSFLNRRREEGTSLSSPPAVVTPIESSPIKQEKVGGAKAGNSSVTAPDNTTSVSSISEDEVTNATTAHQPEAKSDAEVSSKANADAASAPKGHLDVAGLGSLDDLVATVRDEQIKKQEAVSKVISLDDVQHVWDHYIEQQNSPTVSSVLGSTELMVKDNAIVAKVGSTISKNIILQELQLIEKLREDLGVPLLRISIEIDPNQSNQDRPKTMTVKEKFEYLCSVNPNFRDFSSEFGLKPDHV